MHWSSLLYIYFPITSRFCNLLCQESISPRVCCSTWPGLVLLLGIESSKTAQVSQNILHILPATGSWELDLGWRLNKQPGRPTVVASIKMAIGDVTWRNVSCNQASPTIKSLLALKTFPVEACPCPDTHTDTHQPVVQDGCAVARSWILTSEFIHSCISPFQSYFQAEGLKLWGLP